MVYWIVTLALLGVGVLGALSIGGPFLLVGLALVVLWPLRRRPAWFWSPLMAIIAYNIGYWATAPLSCVASATTAPDGVTGEGVTICTSLLGTRFTGTGFYQPPSEPAIWAGLFLAGIAFILTLAVMLWWRWLGRTPRLETSEELDAGHGSVGEDIEHDRALR